jgi:polysaccharide biosynthesis/export protein
MKHRLFSALCALWLIAFAAPASAADATADYVLAGGDVVRATVFQSPDLTLETRITETGTITYPLLGSIKLGGLSVAKAEEVIARGLRDGNFLKQPQVTLVVMQVRGNQVSVLGMVNKPGRFPIDITGMRMSELLAQAGGVAAGGSDVATLSGTREGKAWRVEVDMPALLARGQGNDPVVNNGDVIFVDRMPTIYIYGEVQRPGALRLERDMSVMQALAAGGGLTQRGTEKGLRVHRKASDGKLLASTPALDDRLQDGDVLFVRESLF